jgi:ketosteroid isomerase-like protein
LPEALRPKAVDATVDLDNLITGSALPQLKAIFGGMPTEGERKVLLELQGSSSKTPAQRQAIFERAIQAANNRIKFNTQKAQQLRSGQYFAGDGGLDTTVEPNPGMPGAASTPAAAPAMKNAKGWTLHTDAKGNKAYVSPDGKQFEEVR